MLKSGIYLAGVLGGGLLLAGCGTSGQRAESPRSKSIALARMSTPLPPHWDSELAPGQLPESPASVVPQPVPPAVPPPNLNSVKTNAPLFETGKVALSQWAARSGYGPVRVVPLQPKPAYTVKTPAGTWALRADSHLAYFERMEIRLGFAPQLVGDQLFVHALDVRKVLEPLANGLSVVVPAQRVVVLDPGHGGAHTGTRSVVDGGFEKDYALDWARRLQPLLEQSGWRVYLTRTNDVEISLPDRIAIADAKQAHLFLSLHFNSAGEGREQAGLETYVLSPEGMPSNLTRGYEDDVKERLPNNAFDDQNLRYAVRLHRSLLQVNGNKDRGVRHARFLGVLRNQKRPAVLIEGGYLSNPQEARQIATPEYRQKLAEAIARALE